MAVDVEHKPILHNDVVQNNNDTQQLAPIALKAKDIVEVDTLAANAAPSRRAFRPG